MSEQGMTGEQIERVFGALSEIRTQGLNTAKWMEEHAKADKAAFDTITNEIVAMKVSNGRQKGFLSALAGVGGVLGVAAGYAIDLLTMRGHH
jgi:hypothetical protein